MCSGRRRSNLVRQNVSGLYARARVAVTRLFALARISGCKHVMIRISHFRVAPQVNHVVQSVRSASPATAPFAVDPRRLRVCTKIRAGKLVAFNAAQQVGGSDNFGTSRCPRFRSAGRIHEIMASRSFGRKSAPSREKCTRQSAWDVEVNAKPVECLQKRKSPQRAGFEIRFRSVSEIYARFRFLRSAARSMASFGGVTNLMTCCAHASDASSDSSSKSSPS